MSEEQITEEQRISELKSRYDKLVSYANTQDDFIWVYRAEGKLDPNLASSGIGGTNEGIAGSWFTLDFNTALIYKNERQDTGNEDMAIYAVIIPKDIFDRQDDIFEKHFQGGIVNLPQTLSGAKEVVTEEKELPPNREEYISQFPFVKEYRKLTTPSSDEL